MPESRYCTMLQFCAPAGLGCVLLLTAGWLGSRDARPIAAHAAMSGPPSLVWQAPEERTANAAPASIWQIVPLLTGTRIVLAGGAPAGEVVTAGFAAVGQPDVSFDGSRILFAGKRAAEDSPAIWEIDLRTREARLVVRCANPCDRAIYLSTLYKLDALAPVDQIAFRALDPKLGAPQLFRCQTDGNDVQQITFVPRGVGDPVLLGDGRLRFSAYAPKNAASPGGTQLLTINTDGTDVFPALRSATAAQTHNPTPPADPEYRNLAVMLLEPRPKPPGRSTVVDAQVEIGQLYCLNAYLSDIAKAAGDVEISRVRVFTADANTSAPSLLGELEVERDGSFFAELPARTPLQLETVSAQGATLQRMQSWFWVMPKERRGCIGCHEDRQLSPPNRHVFALRKQPQRLGAHSAETLQKDE